jgi:acetyltransferase-like isoleucine patch superfamily enzyme
VSDAEVFVHSHGLCESEHVGARTRIWAFAHVAPGAVVGEDCNICDHVYVEEGARLGRNVTVKNGVSLWRGVTIDDDVFVGPNAVFTNDLRPRAAIKKGADELLSTTLERGCTVGANATIVCGVVIGADAFVAAGAVVTADVPPHALVAGNPARRIGWVCICGETLPATRAGDGLACAVCGRGYELIDDAKGLRPTPAADG